MPLVKLKQKGQLTLPVEIRRELALDEGDVLEAQVKDGKILLTPKELVDRRREAAFKRIEAIAARARWEAEGKTEEEMERLIEEEVEAVRAERYAREQKQKARRPRQ